MSEDETNAIHSAFFAGLAAGLAAIAFDPDAWRADRLYRESRQRRRSALFPEHITIEGDDCRTAVLRDLAVVTKDLRIATEKTLARGEKEEDARSLSESQSLAVG